MTDDVDHDAAKSADYERLWANERLPVLFEAVRYCTSFEIPLWEWAATAVLNLILEHHFGGLEGQQKRGTAKQHRRRYRDEHLHYTRWQALSLAIERQGHGKELFRRRGKPSASETEARKQALDLAAKMLGGKNAEHSQILFSFGKVERALSAGDIRYRFDKIGM
jgi:hypothetical protein